MEKKNNIIKQLSIHIIWKIFNLIRNKYRNSKY